MARTKTTANPPPPLVNYRESYSWASDRLLTESSTLTSTEDWKDHTKSEPIGKAFGRDDDAYISVRPCVPGEPVCVDNRSNNGEPFFFFYQTVFKRVGQRLPFNSFERELLIELNVPLPSYTPIAGHSSGPSHFSWGTLASPLQWMSSSTSLKRRAPGTTSG